MKKTASALCLLVLLSASTLMLAEHSSVSALNNPWTWENRKQYWTWESREPNPDLALPLIYIRSNGTVEGTDLIQRNGDTYTFTGNIGGRQLDRLLGLQGDQHVLARYIGRARQHNNRRSRLQPHWKRELRRLHNPVWMSPNHKHS
jgi:hypothetical protein